MSEWAERPIAAEATRAALRRSAPWLAFFAAASGMALAAGRRFGSPPASALLAAAALADEGWEMYQPSLYYAAGAALSALGAGEVGALRCLNALALAASCAALIGSLRILFPSDPRRVLAGTVLGASAPIQLYLAQYATNELWAAAFAVLYAGQDTFTVRINRHLAWMTEQCLRLVGLHAGSSGAVVSLSGFAVEIRNNCNAIYEVGLYAAAVWAYPASWRERLVGTLIGTAVLYVVNFLRILTLLAVGLLWREWFDATHLYAWQAIFFLVVGACWIGWVSRIRPVA